MASRGGYVEDPLIFSQDQVSFDANAFDNFVEAHGIEFKHWKAVPCTGGDNDRGSPRSTHLNHDCSNGFFYKGGKCFLGVFDNNTAKKHYRAEGIIDSAITMLHVPRFYKGNECQIFFGISDRLDLVDESIVVPKWEKMICSPTGTDRPMFPIVKIEYVIGMNGEEYVEGTDFEIVNGNIHWISQHRPQFFQELGTGGVYAARYLYRPSWYIGVVLHEIRLVNTYDPADGTKKQIRYPQLLMLQREIYYLNQLRNEENDEPREALAPSSGMNLSIK